VDRAAAGPSRRQEASCFPPVPWLRSPTTARSAPMSAPRSLEPAPVGGWSRAGTSR